MTSSDNSSQRGIIYTFYSFKGGVGRTMALANVAALLAKWGHSVLIVDWDLEAPGLERFFTHANADLDEATLKRPGVLDLIESTKQPTPLKWRDSLLHVDVGQSSCSLSMITAGRRGEGYSERLYSLNIDQLFEEYDLGLYIEVLREEWVSQFDFVLVDSRTGLTDIGGICTVHLADVLVLLFTANESSTNGAVQVIQRARKAQERLPVDRGRLLALPVPTRDESRTEYDLAARWKDKFADLFGEFYRDWLPSAKTAHDAIELLRIPYVPYWSFGERLPVIEEGTSDPVSIGRAYEVLARLLASRLDWYAALQGETLAPPPARARRELDTLWLEQHRERAQKGLSANRLKGFMEMYHYSPDSSISKNQSELLRAAMQSQVRTFGWPIGIVLDNSPDGRPYPTDEGIVANVSANHPGPGLYDYWTLNRGGDFYTLTSLFEDDSERRRLSDSLYFDTRIVRTTEGLLHCVNLYKALGIEPNAQIEVKMRYGGLRGRRLTAASHNRLIMERAPAIEDQVNIPPLVFRISTFQDNAVQLVKKLCAPLFVIFDFAEISDAVYAHIVIDFLNGKLS